MLAIYHHQQEAPKPSAGGVRLLSGLSALLFPALCHRPERRLLHHADIGEDGLMLVLLNLKHSHDHWQRLVVQARGAAHAGAPLGAHRLEHGKGLHVAIPQLHGLLAVLWLEAEDRQ